MIHQTNSILKYFLIGQLLSVVLSVFVADFAGIVFGSLLVFLNFSLLTLVSSSVVRDISSKSMKRLEGLEKRVDSLSEDSTPTEDEDPYSFVPRKNMVIAGFVLKMVLMAGGIYLGLIQFQLDSLSFFVGCLISTCVYCVVVYLVSKNILR